MELAGYLVNAVVLEHRPVPGCWHGPLAQAAQANPIPGALLDCPRTPDGGRSGSDDVCRFCVQFAPVLSVHGAVKVLVEVAGTTAMNVCGLGADIF